MDGVHFILLLFHLYYYFFLSSFHGFISVLQHISVSSPLFLHFILSLSLPCSFLFEVSSFFRKNFNSYGSALPESFHGWGVLSFITFPSLL
jgi:hypothetical protein